MNVQMSRPWLSANVVGAVAGMLLFAVIADSGWAEEPKLLDMAAHLAGMVVFGAVLGFQQRRAIAARRTSLPVWAGVLGLVQFLSFGLAFEFAGPPFDFVVAAIALGVSTGFLVRREARGAQLPVVRGSLAGVAAVVGMVPVFLVADWITDAMGGGFPPFAVILALLGAVQGLALGALVRPPRAVAAQEAGGDIGAAAAGPPTRFPARAS